MIQLNRKICFVAVTMLLAYVTSYFLWSRISARIVSEPWGMQGFYFVFPSSARAKLINHWITIVYFPLVYIESVLGTGPGLAHDPLEILTLKMREGETLSGYVATVTVDAPPNANEMRLCHVSNLKSDLDDCSIGTAYTSRRHHAFPRNRFTLIE